jgi:hypothetical protein
MIGKIIPVFTAAAISMGITFVVPVAITAVSSFTFVSEAQAFGYKSFKKSIKKTDSFVWKSIVAPKQTTPSVRIMELQRAKKLNEYTPIGRNNEYTPIGKFAKR